MGLKTGEALVAAGREHPSKTGVILNRIVYLYKCRFISLAEGIDSNDDVKWHIVRNLFTYFAQMFSRNLSMKVKNGLRNKKDKGGTQAAARGRILSRRD